MVLGSIGQGKDDDKGICDCELCQWCHPAYHIGRNSVIGTHFRCLIHSSMAEEISDRPKRKSDAEQLAKQKKRKKSTGGPAEPKSVEKDQHGKPDKGAPGGGSSFQEVEVK